MPRILQYTREFNEQAVRFSFDSIKPPESRKGACRRLASKVNVKEVTLHSWVKGAVPAARKEALQPGSVDELHTF